MKSRAAFQERLRLLEKENKKKYKKGGKVKKSKQKDDANDELFAELLLNSILQEENIDQNNPEDNVDIVDETPELPIEQEEQEQQVEPLNAAIEEQPVDIEDNLDQPGEEKLEPWEESILGEVENIKFVNTFNVDISKNMDEIVLQKIAMYLDEVTSKDIANRDPWLDSLNKYKESLGFTLEDEEKIGQSTENIGSEGKVVTKDSTFSSSLLRLWSIIRPEILPNNGPVGYSTSVENNDVYELTGEKIKDQLNEYLTVEDKGFYSDYEKFLFQFLFTGFVVRKVYINTITKKPISRFISPENFLFDTNCNTIKDSSRLTHIRFFSKKEIIMNIQGGNWRNIELPYLNQMFFNSLETQDAEHKQIEPTNSKFKFFETYEYLDLDSFSNEEVINIPKPYVITRCASTNKIVSIIPNWEKDDENFQRIDYFIPYTLFPGFDCFGLGLAHLIGSNSCSITKMQQMAIDAAEFQNFPGFIMSKDVKLINNDINIKAGQALAVDAGEMPIRDSIMQLPYSGPSPALLEYMERISRQIEMVSSGVEMDFMRSSENTPVGTTLAMMEMSNRLHSAIFSSVHKSFSEEIELIYKLSDFLDYNDKIKVIPTSNPSVESTTQRIIKAESILKIASSAPELHDMKKVYERVYKAMGVVDYESLFIETQNQNIEQEEKLDPALQLQMAELQQRELELQQRKLEVESKERIAQMQIEADAYKIQMNIELENKKIEQNKLLAEMKIQMEEDNNISKRELETIKLEKQEKSEYIEKVNSLLKDKEVELSSLLKDKEDEINALKQQMESMLQELNLEKNQEL